MGFIFLANVIKKKNKMWDRLHQFRSKPVLKLSLILCCIYQPTETVEPKQVFVSSPIKYWLCLWHHSAMSWHKALTLQSAEEPLKTFSWLAFINYMMQVFKKSDL